MEPYELGSIQKKKRRRWAESNRRRAPQVVALIQEAADGAPDAGPSLAALLQDAAAAAAAGRGGLRVGDALQLLAFCYSLAGDLTPPAAPLYSEDERAVAGALAGALAASLEGREGAAALDADAWAALPAPLQDTLSEVIGTFLSKRFGFLGRPAGVVEWPLWEFKPPTQSISRTSGQPAPVVYLP